MAGREKDWDDANGSKEAGSCDPETLYTKEFCIGSSHASFPFLVGGAPVAGKREGRIAMGSLTF